MQTPEEEEHPKSPGESNFEKYAHEAASRPLLKFSDKKSHAEQQQIMRETAPYLTLGIQMVLTIGVFFGIGDWLDHRFHSTPLWTAILSGIGAVAALTYFIVTVVRLSQKTETKRR